MYFNMTPVRYLVEGLGGRMEKCDWSQHLFCIWLWSLSLGCHFEAGSRWVDLGQNRKGELSNLLSAHSSWWMADNTAIILWVLSLEGATENSFRLPSE